MILFRQTPSGFPFFWEDRTQPEARWHAADDGPVQYLSDTPDGTWAEFLRHQDISDSEDLPGIQRDLWAIQVPDREKLEFPDLPIAVCIGSKSSYARCQKEANRLKNKGKTGIQTTSAALLPGAASGWNVDGGLKPFAPRDGKVYVLFGRRPDLEGWKAATESRPDRSLLKKVRYF